MRSCNGWDVRYTGVTHLVEGLSPSSSPPGPRPSTCGTCGRDCSPPPTISDPDPDRPPSPPLWPADSSRAVETRGRKYIAVGSIDFTDA